MAIKRKPNRITISVDWYSVASIKRAERQKSALEKEGYTLIGETANNTLVYELQKGGPK